MSNKKPTLAYIKRQARNLKKEKSLTHTQALELIAKKYGFSNWKHCQRSLSEEPVVEALPVNQPFQLTFIDWLKRHKNRQSPLGDLARQRGFLNKDGNWPLYDNLNAYRGYLELNNPPRGTTAALESAWKRHKEYLKLKNSMVSKRPTAKKPAVKNHDPRSIVRVKGAIPLHYEKRTQEQFSVGDPAWISWDGKKAIPVTIVEVDARHYSFRIERPLKTAGSTHFVFLDEVRSSPELACINHVTN